MVLKERMAASGPSWRWVSSERQYADGLTKEGARQLLADRLRKGALCGDRVPVLRRPNACYAETFCFLFATGVNYVPQ